MLDASSNLNALKGAAATLGSFAASLAAGPLNEDLPILSGGASELAQILGLSNDFSVLGNALNQINTANVTGAGDPKATLQSELGSGFTVSEVSDNQVLVSYSQSINASPSVSAATSLSDFFGNNAATNYLSKITSLSGSAAAQFASGTKFTVTFGANSSGLFVNPGPLFSSPDLSATMNLNGQVGVGQIGFEVDLNGSGTIDLKNVNLAITQQVSGAALSNIGQLASLNIDNNSKATVSGDFEAKVLGVDLLSWNPTLTWNFASNGTPQSPQLSIPQPGQSGTPSFDANGEASVESTLESKMLDALGLSQLNVLLNPLASAPPALADIIDFVGSVLAGALDDPQLDPASGFSKALNALTDGSFHFASPTDLMNIAAGNAGDLVTFSEQNINFLNLNLTPDITIPGFSVLGILNIEFQVGMSFTFTGTANLGMGIDTSGVFVNTDQTNLKFSAGVGADAGVTVNCLGIDNPATATIGPKFTTTATLGLNPTGGTSDKAYLSDLVSGLDESNGLSGIASSLEKDLHLHLDISGAIDLNIQIRSPLGGIIDALGPAGDVLEPFAEGFEDFVNFVSGAVETICTTVESVPFFGGLVKDIISCHTAKEVTHIAFGEYVQILVPFAESIGADKTLSGASPDGQTANLVWVFPISDFQKDFGPTQITQGNSAADTPNASAPSDFIQYQVSGGTLTVTGQAGTDNVEIHDLGGGNIELVRSGVDSSNNVHSDPTRIFSGITQINANLNDSAGSKSSFTMDPSLKINTSVTAGAGDDTVKTGAGDDTINGGAGKSDLEGGAGTNKIVAGSGDSTLVGGPDKDELDGGAGKDVLIAGSGTELLNGGGGDDVLIAGIGTDEMHGGGGNDTFIASTGTDTMFGEGGSADLDTFFGGAGADTMTGGQGMNIYHCGAGTTTVNGGPAGDLIYWEVGDGNATVDGGNDTSPTAIDRLQIRGSANPDTFTASANGAGVTIGAPGATLNATNINVLNIDAIDGADTTTINDLSGTTVQVVGLDLGEIGAPDGALDQIILNGPASPRTVNIGEIAGTGNVNGNGPTVSGQVMLVTGLGPTFLVANDDNALTTNLAAGANSVTVNTPTMRGAVTVNGSVGGDTYDIQAISGPTTINAGRLANTINVGSLAPAVGGKVDGIQAALVVNGGGADTVNVDDTGSTIPKTGTLTGTTLTGLGMGPAGITYGGIQVLNIGLGSGGNTFNIVVDALHDLPATIAVNGGSSANDQLNAQFLQDFNHQLNLLGFEFATISVAHDFNGTMSDTAPGNIQLLTVGHAVKPTGSLRAGNVTEMTVGPNALTPGDDMAGQIVVTGTLTDLRVAGGTPGTITAGHIGTIRVYGGYGPIVGQIMESGVERRIEAAVPGQPYPVAVPPPNPSPAPSPAGVTVQYDYESGALANPQLTARITNVSGNSQPDQFDLSLVVWNDRAKFNLARLDASGVSGVRNVAIEGDLLSSVSPAATAFFVLPNGTTDASPAGVDLPLDRLAGVGVRDFASNGSIAAKSIEAVAFGSFLDRRHTIELGTCACESDAEQLLACGTSIVQAGSTNGQNAESFRVPFADLKNEHVAFFVATEEYPRGFSNDTMAFTVQGIDNGLTVQPNNVARGAVTALISVTRPLDKHGRPEDAIVQTVALNGDGGSIQSDQFIAQGITSTGPLGDVCVAACQGINNITAPSIFGNITTNGAIFGTIQTTGVRIDPISGASSTVPADLGRAYVVTPQNPWCQPYIATTTIQAGGGGGLCGSIISRGNLISSIRGDCGISALIAAQGNIGAFSTLLGAPVRVGSILSNGPLSGRIIALGNILADLTLHGGLHGGEIAAHGQSMPGFAPSQTGILGNVDIDGVVDRCSAIVSGGEIGDRSLCTTLSFGNNQGIIAAKGTINFDRWSSPWQGSAFNNVGSSASTDPNAPLDAAAIDAIFTQGGQPLRFDITPGDLAGLAAIEHDLNALSIGVNSKGRYLKGTTQ
jgi:hypothetical protein